VTRISRPKIAFRKHLVAFFAIFAAIGGRCGDCLQLHAQQSRKIPLKVIPSPAKATTVYLLDSKSVWDIGGLKENEDDEFLHNNGALTALLTFNGAAIVVDTYRIRFFTAAGKQSLVIGRRGRGPGEFINLSGVCQTRGDTIVASDPATHRFSVLTPTGTRVREVSTIAGSMPAQGCFDDGTFILSNLAPKRNGYDMVTIKRYDLFGKLLNEVGTFPLTFTQGGVQFQLNYGAIGTSLWVADSRDGHVWRYNQLGNLEAEYQLSSPKQELSNSGSLVLDAPPSKNPERASLPKHYPMFSDTRISRDGLLWVQDYHPFGSRIDRWTAYDVIRGTATTLEFASAPLRGPTLLSVERNRMFSLSRDSSGAAHFTLTNLIRR